MPENGGSARWIGASRNGPTAMRLLFFFFARCSNATHPLTSMLLVFAVLIPRRILSSFLRRPGSGRLSGKQLEATRRMVSRHIRKKEKLWIRAFPDIPVTTKPIQIRMGKGKGAVDHWIHKLPAGKMIMEIGAMPETKAKAILLGAAKKLGVACAFVNRKLDRF